MITLVVLLLAFGITLFIQRLVKKQVYVAQAGRIAMAVMLILTGVSHFIFTKGMSLMLPQFLPKRELIVWLTGVLEILGAIGLLVSKTQRLTSILIIIFFVSILPSNIYASLHHVNYQTATFDGKGPEYLWIRIPMQIVFILWVWYFGYKKERQTVSSQKGEQ
ncbi:DoxX family protein [Chryseosolibacter indicus]|uniref:DoxX family membrane protein n=1 Tax=Chryseosolibacter indicus TaxID=2782351 RepID=A0ABS5VQ35_9BACT|nr:DoxX family membrane protein [Chryseosolibacter indicus]MBT1702907.1 DoxX family membrane protein [Chryseosolibacter indicus]